MADGFEGLGGLVLGGQGEFFEFLPPGCNLVLCEDGCMDSLDLLRGAWEMVYKAGLYQNDYTPLLETDLSKLVVANFSGYAGLQVTFGWSPAVMVGFRAESLAAPINWVHDGGPVQNWVYGYYVVNQYGTLVWAERFCPAPIPMNGLGQTLRIRPRFRQGTEFPE